MKKPKTNNSQLDNNNLNTFVLIVGKEIQLKQARIFRKANPEYGQKVAEGLGITP